MQSVASRGGARAGGLADAAGRILPLVAFLLAPLALAGAFLWMVISDGLLGGDYRYVFWQAGQDVLHGRTPYPPLDPSLLAHRAAFVYPPIVAIALTPFSLLPVWVATVLMVLLCAAAIACSLWVLDVRDWRCYTVVLASPAVLACLQTAAFSGFLALAVALAWRHRARGWTTPVLLAVAITAKLFLWPLLLWLVIVRGLRCGVATGAGVLALIFAPWLLGFPGLEDYRQLLSLLTDVEGAHAYTPRALAHSLGAGWRVSEAVALVAGGGVLLAALALRRGADAHRRTLALTVLASLLLSPLVWAHYLLVLLPLLALASRRLSWAWFVPLGLWFAGGTWGTPSSTEIAVSLAVMVLAAAAVFQSSRDSAPAASWSAPTSTSTG
jgi:hypothetical protein